MIKLKKTSVLASIKDNKGNCKLSIGTSELCKQYDLEPHEYNIGSKKLQFDNKIYGDSKLKEQLRIDQNGKCAFCEQNIVSLSHGDVEHYRPKGGYSQNEKDDLHKPGYYWLAYEWNNLLLVCEICNRRHKKNYFPLRNPEKRALNHHQDISQEKPFFVNPYIENPGLLIGFRREVAFGKDRRHRGKKTIETIGLNRSSKKPFYKDLLEDRREYLIVMTHINNISKKNPGGELSAAEIDEANQIIKNAKKKSSKFSAMLRENFG